MDEFRYIVPDKVWAEEIERVLGKVWTCPYCNAQSTRARGASDTGWVQTPLRQTSPPWICLGCCIDIYSACLSTDFAEHPYRDFLEAIGRREGLTLDSLRTICLEHQLRLATSRAEHAPDDRYESPRQRLRLLLGLS